MCTSYPYAPFEFEQDGEVVGFDIDLVNEVADELGVDVSYVNEDFEDIESGKLLNANFCDLGVAAVSIDGDRARVDRLLQPLLQRRAGDGGAEGERDHRRSRHSPVDMSPYRKARPVRPMPRTTRRPTRRS